MRRLEQSLDSMLNEFALVQSKNLNSQFQIHMSIYRRVLRYYRPFLWQTLFGLCLSLLGVGLNLLKPWPFKIIVDDFLRAGSAIRPDWRMWVLLLCLAFIGIPFLWRISD